MTELEFYDVEGRRIRFDKEGVHIVVLTPKLVDYLLSLNTHNRAVRSGVVSRYTNEIQKNHWRRSNQGIGVDINGVLTDGQHRLLAAKAAGYAPIKIELSTGLDEDVQAVVDTHAKRSQTDVVRLLLDRTVTNSMVAAINAMFIYEGEHTVGRAMSRAPTHRELAEFLTEHSDLIEGVVRFGGAKTPASVNAALLAFGLRGYEGEALEIASKLKLGLFDTGTCPIYRLSKKMSEMRGRGNGPDRTTLYRCTVNACIAYARKEKLQLLKEASNWDRLPKRVKSTTGEPL